MFSSPAIKVLFCIFSKQTKAETPAAYGGICIFLWHQDLALVLIHYLQVVREGVNKQNDI